MRRDDTDPTKPGPRDQQSKYEPKRGARVYWNDTLWDVWDQAPGAGCWWLASVARDKDGEPQVVSVHQARLRAAARGAVPQ